MRRLSYIAFTVSLCLLIAVSEVRAQQAVFTDSSGKIQVGLFYGLSAQASHPSLIIPVGGEWVVVGGGGYTSWREHGGVGSLLTASYPDPYMSAWNLEAKDHLRGDPSVIHGYALAIRIKGLTRQQLLGYVRQTRAESAYVSHPNATAYLESGYTLLGCGFFDWYGSGAGNMAVDSYPVNNTGCYSGGKDHVEGSAGVMYSYAIGIRTVIPGVGNFVNVIQSSLSSYSPHPYASATVPYGYALTGGGADVTYHDQGQMLWRNTPTIDGGWSVGSKDHLVSDWGYVRAYAIGLAVW